MARNTVFPFGGEQEALFTVSVDGVSYIRSACVGNSLIFNVFDANTFEPWKNVDANGNNLFTLEAVQQIVRKRETGILNFHI
jgi:hypothetical protein